MRIGVPRESKPGERRVALLPEAARALVDEGHRVAVEAGAGLGIGLDDAAYAAAGAESVSAAAAWGADLVVKVKEVLEPDLAHLPAGATVFSFHHLPGEPGRVRALAARGVTAIAFEMVRDERGTFPLLAPMSRIAGRMAVETGAGLLGARMQRVLVLGAGHAGLAAVREAASRGGAVTLLTRSAGSRDAARAAGFDAGLASPASIEREALRADLVVGAVFVPGQPTPKLLPRALVRRMKRGAMIADVSIDAGGVAETSRATTHAEPTFVEEGVVHYCVANMPAASPPQAAAEISAAALPYVSALAAMGIEGAVAARRDLREAVLLWKGRVTHEGIARESGLAFHPLA